jgi:alpha-glucosidase
VTTTTPQTSAYAPTDVESDVECDLDADVGVDVDPQLVAPDSAPPRPWWRDAVVYQVYIRSFADGDGDGIGDLAGIRARLPYLRDLGVDAVWITPFYPSPMADGGYDVADYRAIEPLFGALEDADALIAEAHAAGLRVVVDVVPNHSSDQHAWFRAALASAPGSPERARYIFRPGRGATGELPPTDWKSVFGGPAWRRVTEADGSPGEWYLHLFAPEQPDFDWTNPEVVAEFHDILRFWLDRGVDGFRIDVAHGLVKDPALPDIGAEQEQVLDAWAGTDHPFWDREGVHEIYRGWRKVLDAYAGDRMAVAEAWVKSPDRLARYVRPDELHQAFNFDFVETDWEASAFRGAIDAAMSVLAGVGADAQWVLSNHDIVRHVTRFGGGSKGLRRARAATLLMLALPGGAYLYQGEELGLYEVEDLPEDVLQDPVWLRSGHTEKGRDGCRVPLPWTRGGPSFGFGGGGSWLPQPGDWGGLSVQAQDGTPGSTLELYRLVLALRRALPALGAGNGAFAWEPGPSPDVLTFRRGADVVVVVNFGAVPVALPAAGEVLVASGPLTAAGELPADAAVWLRTN